MVKMIEGITVDSSQFPHSYSLINKARAIAIHFKQSVEDILQELMYLELIHREKKIKDTRGYLIASLYQNTLKRSVRDKKREERAEEFYQGYFSRDELKILQDKIFLNEFVAILKRIDQITAELVEVISANTEKSLFQVYKIYYADEISQGKFYKRIRKLRYLAKKYSTYQLRRS